ncbi:MAG: ADP-ribosylglycohydrolase family protein, partial [Bacteroidales bacterium]
MKTDRIASEFYAGCMLGAAVGSAMGNCCRQENKTTGFTHPFYFDGLMQLALFTAEGLLRATHRAKMHGSNGTFSELIYESYQRWLKTQLTDFNDLVEMPQNDGWLVRRSEMYHKGYQPKHTMDVLKKKEPGDMRNPVSGYSDYEAMMRVFPIGLMFPGDLSLCFQIGCETAALTHGVEEGYLCGGFFAALISGIASGKSLSESIEPVLEILDNYPADGKAVRTAITDALYFSDDLAATDPMLIDEQIEKFISGMTDQENARNILSYALVCLLSHPDDFHAAISMSLRYKAATHAVAMFVGAVCGLVNSESAIPGDWISQLRHKEIVLQLAQDLLVTIKGGIYIADREWKRKYPG